MCYEVLCLGFPIYCHVSTSFMCLSVPSFLAAALQAPPQHGTQQPSAVFCRQYKHRHHQQKARQMAGPRSTRLATSPGTVSGPRLPLTLTASRLVHCSTASLGYKHAMWHSSMLSLRCSWAAASVLSAILCIWQLSQPRQVPECLHSHAQQQVTGHLLTDATSYAVNCDVWARVHKHS